ncbi:MAG: hypothetical protein ACHQCH_05855 [Solirubrobacterales bacterium]
MVLAAAVCLLAVPSLSSAGEYHVYSCRTPAGSPAPIEGWTGSVGGAWDYDGNSCPGGGALYAAEGANFSHLANTDLTTWAFNAPPGESIAKATLWRAGDTAGGTASNATYVFWLAAPNYTYDSANVFDACPNNSCPGQGETGNPLSGVNRVELAPSNLGSHIYMTASCGGVTNWQCPGGPGDASGFAVVVYVYEANIVLKQDSQPSASGVGGELASAATVSGTSDLTFSAADAGSGIYQAVFNVDGHVVQSLLLNENDGRCRNVGQTTDGLAAFLSPQPCLPSLSADIPFNTTALSNGPHHLIVSVTDAASNSAVVLDRQITVANAGGQGSVGSSVGVPVGPGSPLALRGALNGTNASDQAKLTAHWTRTRKVALTSSYGVRNRISGTLTTLAGQPVSGAAIDVYATPAYEGAPARQIGDVSTGSTGKWTLVLGGNLSSSALSLRYRSHVNDTIPVATAALGLRVHAGITLKIAPRSVSVGRRIFFSGVLHGAPIPSGGKQLVLEASSGGEWIQFDTIRTDVKGRYHASYRFRFPGPATYRFRVLSRYEADFPFIDGTSRNIAVHEH